jgi:putative thioredoxin
VGSIAFVIREHCTTREHEASKWAGDPVEARTGIDSGSATFLPTMADVTDATFETDVVERSKTVPVVVDLWAEWCGPCKQLGPILEKVIAATGGQVELAKVDVDANPSVGQAFKVQSIPAVYAMKDGQIVDGFMGAQPEAQVQEFVDRLLPTSELSDLERLIEAGDEASLVKALEIEPDNPAAVTALAGLLVEQGDVDTGLSMLERIPETAETRRITALARTGGVGDDVESTLGELLAKVKTDEDARQKFVDLLEVLGPEDPRAVQWRRKLSTALF